MGLAGSFGKDGYKCGSCGRAVQHYSPNCPSCLSSTLTRIEKPKPAPVGAETREPIAVERTSTHSGPGALIGGVILALMFIAAMIFGAAGRQAGHNKADEAPVRAQPTAADIRAYNSQFHHPRHVAAHPAAAKPHAAASAVAPAPRRALPMKLWQVTRDSE